MLGIVQGVSRAFNCSLSTRERRATRITSHRHVPRRVTNAGKASERHVCAARAYGSEVASRARVLLLHECTAYEKERERRWCNCRIIRARCAL